MKQQANNKFITIGDVDEFMPQPEARVGGRKEYKRDTSAPKQRINNEPFQQQDQSFNAFTYRSSKFQSFVNITSASEDGMTQKLDGISERYSSDFAPDSFK